MDYCDINGDKLPELPPLRTFKVQDNRHEIPEIVQAHTLYPSDHRIDFVMMQYLPDGCGHYTVVTMIKRSLWGVLDVEEISSMVAPGTKTLN